MKVEVEVELSMVIQIDNWMLLVAEGKKSTQAAIKGTLMWSRGGVVRREAGTLTVGG